MKDCFSHSGRLFAALALAALAPGALAAPVTPDQARAEAAAFRRAHVPGLRQAPPVAQDQLSLAYQSVTDSGENCFYVFNNPDGSGFTIVSADDRLPAVLGFSENGSFDLDRIPSNMKWWLGEYCSEISRFLAEDPAMPPLRRRAMAKDRDPIEAMLTSRWDQGDPYNRQCPIDSYANRRSVTGCVATAMAQVMRYHQWPINPTGISGSYIFNGTTLDWANMLDDYSGSYTATEADAVALLMRQCGASVNMMYSAYESGAYSENVPVALYDHFGYSKSIAMEWRDYHTQNEWDDMVYAELEAGRPVYYSGRSALGGHAFVCDGYLSNGFFHFNWGWGGYQDGYFILSALNPSSGGTGSYDGGYNTNQAILTGVKPSDGETQMQTAALCTGSFIYRNGIFCVSDDPDGYDMIYNPLSTSLQATFGVEITPWDGSGSPVYAMTASQTVLASRYGTKEMTVTIPNLPAGKYKICPCFKNAYGEIQPVQVPIGKQEYVTLTVEGGKKTFSNDGAPTDRQSHLIFGVPEMPTAVYDNVAKVLRLVVSNVSGGDFRDKISMFLSDIDDPFGDAVTVYSDVILPGRTSSIVEFSTPEVIRPGNYEVYITTYMGEILCDVFEVEVKASGADTQMKGDLQLMAFGPNFHTMTPDGIPMSIAIQNESSEALTANVGVRVLDAGFKELKSASLGEVSFEPDHLTNLSVAPAQLGLAPGEYFWNLTVDGKPTGAIFPLILSGEVKEKNGVYYTSVSESPRQALVVPPTYEEYSGSVNIPDAIDGYTVTALRADAFTFASDVTEVSLPSGLSRIEPGTFYSASSLKRLNVNGSTPAVAMTDAFAPDAPEGILLSPANGTANFYASEDGWADFRISNWTLQFGDGCEVLGGLLLDPLTNKWYSPYYIGADERLAINIQVPEGMQIKLSWEIDGETGTQRFDNVVILPALHGASATATVEAADASGVAGLDSEWIPADVYTPSGVCVLRQASREAFQALPQGLYILKGQKILK